MADIDMHDVATHDKRRKRESARKSLRTQGLIWGLHAVAAALRNPERNMDRLMLTRNAAHRIGLDLDALPPMAKLAEPGQIASMLPDSAVHQGICARVTALEGAAFETIAEQAKGPILVLDGITDPQNIGAIFRSAAAFWAPAVLLQARGAPPLFGAAAKAAVGAIESVQEVRTVNLSRALHHLTELGWQSIGLAEQAPLALPQALAQAGEVTDRLVLVLGAEGKGLRPNIAKACTYLASIALAEDMPSLNVSNAAAIALYEASRGR